MTELLPKLKRIIVDPQKKLYLDPNNPRFITRDDDRTDEERFLDQDVITRTRERMLGAHRMGKSKDEFRIEEIKQSILSNGWNPVDSIFVRRFSEDDERYVVIEGNRRVTAIQQLLASPDTPSDVKKQLREIEVMEVLDRVGKGRNRERSLREIEKKISYLLGVRHHGSLKKWSPFAQASSIYEKYLRIANQGDGSFFWVEHSAIRIAETLTMQTKEVRERLQTFRCMKQIGGQHAVRESEATGGGIKDYHYSLVKEVLQARESALRKYISQDAETFLLDDTSLERLINLCHFDRKDREGSPINNPQQWRFLCKILMDEDEDARTRNLRRVEEGKEKPEDVWAEREAELQTPEWAGWLDGVSRLFQDLPFQKFDPSDSEQIAVLTRLVSIVNLLGERENNAK
jgi:hypothetical protein